MSLNHLTELYCQLTFYFSYDLLTPPPTTPAFGFTLQIKLGMFSLWSLNFPFLYLEYSFHSNDIFLVCLLWSHNLYLERQSILFCLGLKIPRI